MRKTLSIILMMLASVVANAQFTIVDSQDHQPLPGVYVFGSNGILLDMSNENGEVTKATGMVTLSMLSYNPATVDAAKVKGGVVELVSQPLALSEVVVQKTQYYKISGTFRDVVVNFDKVVMYREGLMDFYVEKSSGNIKRRIRACRQYEHPDLRNYDKNDSLNMGICRTFNLANLHYLNTSGQESRGDTTMIWAMHGKKTVKDGVMLLKQKGKYRKIIDGMKFANRNSVSFLGMRETVTKAINDWTFSNPSGDLESLVAYRKLIGMESQFSKRAPVIKIETTQDFVVNDITYLTKAQAKEEMKEKDIETESFTIPNGLPHLPKALTDQVPTMKCTKRRDF